MTAAVMETVPRHGSACDATSTLVVFSLDDAEFALPVQQIVEALRMVAITPIPESPESVPGVINLRGRVIPIVDLRRRLGMSSRAYELRTPILVVQGGGRVVGLIADEVVEMLTLPTNAIDGPETLGRSVQAVAAVARTDGRLIVILDLGSVCNVLDEVVIPDDGPGHA